MSQTHSIDVQSIKIPVIAIAKSKGITILICNDLSMDVAIAHAISMEGFHTNTSTSRMWCTTNLLGFEFRVIRINRLGHWWLEFLMSR